MQDVDTMLEWVREARGDPNYRPTPMMYDAGVIEYVIEKPSHRRQTIYPTEAAAIEAAWRSIMMDVLMHAAYLILVLDVTERPPKIVGADIFSEPVPTMRMSLVPVVVEKQFSIEGYGDAKERLLRRLKTDEWAWVRSIMPRWTGGFGDEL